MILSKRIGACFGALIILFSLVYQPAQGHRSQPQEIYHRAWQLVRDNYYESSFHNQNWNELEHNYDSQIKSTADAHKYIKAMLETLNDPYTRFLDPRAFQDE